MGPEQDTIVGVFGASPEPVKAEGMYKSWDWIDVVLHLIFLPSPTESPAFPYVISSRSLRDSRPTAPPEKAAAIACMPELAVILLVRRVYAHWGETEMANVRQGRGTMLRNSCAPTSL